MNVNKRIGVSINKKLSSSQVFCLLFLNITGPFISFALARVIYLFQFSGTIGFATHNEFMRIMLLILVVVQALLATLNFTMLWKPLVHLENIIQHFRLTKELPANQKEFSKDYALETTFFDILEEQKDAMEREYKTETLRQQAELMVLQSQINPHFLYNTLDSVRGLALIHDVPQIASMTEALSKLFRSMIANEGKLILLSEEFASVDNYMIIQQFRFHNKFSYSTQVEQDLLLNCRIPNLIIQPIVENAVMHGLEKKDGEGVIRIYVYATQSRLVISVEDNGVGIRPQKLEHLNESLQNNRPSVNTQERIGIALTNINSRIKLQFGDSYGLNIMSTQNISTTVEIILPLHLEQTVV